MFLIFVGVTLAWAAELFLCGTSLWRHAAFALVTLALFALTAPLRHERAALRASRLAHAVGDLLFGVEFTTASQRTLERLRPDERPYVFACDPHGAYVLHMVFGFAAHGGRLPAAIARRLFVVAHWGYVFVPFVNVIYEWFGVIPSAHRCVERVLQRGGSIAICPSGVAGKWHSTAPARADDREDGVAVLKRRYDRLGFLVFAARHGAHVVPVLSVDEHRAYATRALNLVLGLWLVLPRTERCELRVGAPIDAAAYDHTSRASMHALADAYYEAIRKLGEPDRRVSFVSQ